MGSRLHKRLPVEFVTTVLEAFNDHRMSEQQACDLLDVERGQLHRLRQRWLRGHRKGLPVA